MSTVSIIVPCRNEARHIATLLDGIREQQLPPGHSVEVLVVDGRSDDGTRSILDAYRAGMPSLRILDNPEGIASTGLNRAIRQARGNIIVRMDAHSEYASDYVLECVRALGAAGAANAGGPARTRAEGYVQRAIAAAYHSPFFVGGARFHDPDHEGWVDTIPYGCWRKETLLGIGLFDEDFVRCQDCELNFRLRQFGGRIWQTPRIRSWYRPRASLRDLARQYHQYGYWKWRVLAKHKRLPSWRQAVPGLALAGLLMVGCFALVWDVAGGLLVAAMLGYASLSAAASIEAVWGERNPGLAPLLPAVFAVVHLSWATGFWMAWIESGFLRRKPRAAYLSLSRNDAVEARR